MTGSFFILAFLFYRSDNESLTYYFSGAGILTLFLYPLYLRFHYRRHYQKFVAETYKNRFNEIATIKFSADCIEASDKMSETKINNVEIQEIIETGEHIYLRMKSGSSLIIPKSKIESVGDFRTTLYELAGKMNINFLSELKWKWK